MSKFKCGLKILEGLFVTSNDKFKTKVEVKYLLSLRASFRPHRRLPTYWWSIAHLFALKTKQHKWAYSTGSHCHIDA